MQPPFPLIPSLSFPLPRSPHQYIMEISYFETINAPLPPLVGEQNVTVHEGALQHCIKVYSGWDEF